MSNNILVTGATGFIGSHLIHRLSLKETNDLVVALVRDARDDYWNKYALRQAVKVTLDLTAPTAIEKLCRTLSHYHIDQIYHFAAQPIVQRAKQNPVDTYKTNIMGTVNVLEAARLMGVKNILTMSTDKIFGEGFNALINSPFYATEPYSSSKICAEYIIEDYRREFGLNICSIRCCNIVGYDPYNPTRIVPNTILKILNKEKPVIYDVKSVRQYIYIEDVIKILMKQIGSSKVFNIGSNHVCSPKKIITLICELMDTTFEFVKDDRTFREIQKQSLLCDRSFEYTPLETMLQKTIDQFKVFY